MLEQIQDYIGQAQLREAIDEMLTLSSDRFPDLHNQIIMQSSRLSQLEQGERNGVLGFSQANMTRAQITNALLSILSDLREELS